MSLRVPKDRRSVIIYTRNHRVEGDIFVPMDAKISEELNIRTREFISITNARIFTLNGDSLLYTTDFITLNKRAIDMVVSKPAPGEI